MTPRFRRLMPALVVAVLAVAAPARAQLGALVSPGRLHRSHAALEGVSQCLKCHSKGAQVSPDKCLSCHTPVAERIRLGRGLHKAAGKDCVRCHVEHAGTDAQLRPFDLTKFDHARDTGWPIEGLHAPLSQKCDRCHRERSYLTARTACTACHKDPHAPSLGPDCSTCHGVDTRFATASARFDHRRTRFPLSGAHVRATCAACHTDKRYRGTPFGTCTACHKDPHAGRMGTACTNCHGDSSWRTGKLDHARTAFPLRGKHAAAECIRCHVKPAATARVRFETCATCHTDPHKGGFREDCAACHTEQTFQKGTFDHGRTRFPLTDGHAGRTCVACHASAQGGAANRDYRGLSTACTACHADVHRNELGDRCESCHATRTWAVGTYTHARPRPWFDGRHGPLTCAQCHASTFKPTRTAAATPALRVGFTTTPVACASCHADVHLGQLQGECDRCHTVDAAKFAIAGFDHARTRFALTGKHGPAKCEACHKVEPAHFPGGDGTARRFTGIGDACVSCHADPHGGRLDRACQSCHSVTSFSLPGYVHRQAAKLKPFFAGRHASAACVRCHAAQAGAARPVDATYTATTACTSCHADIHRGALGPDCGRCHKP